MTSTPGKRLVQFLQGQGFKSTSAFCKETGIGDGTLSAMIARGTSPRAETMRKLKLSFPLLNPDWVLLGEGPMMLPDLNDDALRLTYSSNREAGANQEETPPEMEPSSDITEGERSQYWKGKYEQIQSEKEKWEARERWYQELLLKKPEGNRLLAATDSSDGILRIMQIPPRQRKVKQPKPAPYRTPGFPVGKVIQLKVA